MDKAASSGPRERNSAQTRRDILDAARTLFRHRGYAGTTVHSIAESLGLTDPAVYYHFHSKRQLWQALVDDVVVPTPPAAGIHSAEDLAQWLLAFFFAYARHADVVAMLLREQVGQDAASANYREQAQSFYAAAAQEPLQRLYGDRAELLVTTMTTMLSGMFWDGILTFGTAFSNVATEPQFRERVYRAIALPLGLPRDASMIGANPAGSWPKPGEAPERPGQAHHRRGRDATRTRILQSAVELFSMNGVDGTSVRAIAEHCGLTDPAVYYYFPSKVALLDSLWEAQLDQPAADVAGSEPLTDAGLAAIVDALIGSAANMDSQLRLLIRQVLAGDQVAITMRNDASAQWRAYLFASLSGTFDEVEATDRVDAILAASMGAVLLAQMGHPADFPLFARSDDFRNELLAIVSAIVGVPESSGERAETG
ncbi:MAG: TetR/AcrR family transcriptional regulator [Tepidiformaceae bacterium]